MFTMRETVGPDISVKAAGGGASFLSEDASALWQQSDTYRISWGKAIFKRRIGRWRLLS